VNNNFHRFCNMTRETKMKYTVYDRLLKREVGQERRNYADIRGIYGDRQWIDDLDIVNELDGHSGCVNTLRYSPQLLNTEQ
jgi:nuclear receptor interaction protein